MSNKLEVGDRAPDFQLKDQSGKDFVLSAHLGKGPLVVYFYPSDNTPGCTAEACAFRDQYEDFREAGAEVVGISSNSPKSHMLFIGRHSLPFTLLSDAENKVRKLFGVPKTMGLLPGRVTYVLDKGGAVRYIFNSQINATMHVTRSLDIIRSMLKK
ncbi:MAG: peroxiredoxin [Thermoplasmatota archaeon]